MNSGASCTERRIILAPPMTSCNYLSVALVPGERTVVTTFRKGEEGAIDAEFVLGEDGMRALLYDLAFEHESYLDKV
jgi:hypothetical protein